MGSYAVSCALTGMSLYGDKAVLIPLAPARFLQPSRDNASLPHGANIVTNEGACGILSPLTLPLFGTYDTYGTLGDVERDENVEFLEARLGVKIEDFVEAACTGGRVKKITSLARCVAREEKETFGDRFYKEKAWNGSLYACFIAREAWDVFSKTMWEEDGSTASTVIEGGWLNPTNLRGMGFVRGEKNVAAAISALGQGPHDGTRYHTPYTHESLPRVVVWCDEHMSSRVTVGNRPCGSTYTAADLVSELKKNGLSLPASAAAWASRTSVFRSRLTDAKLVRDEAIQQEKSWQKLIGNDPLYGFEIVSDTTPEAERNRVGTRGALIARRIINGQDPLPEDPRPEIEGGIAQTLCDGSFHIDLRGKKSYAPADTFSVSKCPTPGACDGGGKTHHGAMDVPPAALDALRALGWTKKKPARRSIYGRIAGSPLDLFPEEMRRLYRGKIFSKAFMPRVEELLTFTMNMHDANKLYQPTMNGRQCGHPHTQARVAELALSVCRRRIAEMEEP